MSSTRIRPALVVLGTAALLTTSVAVPQASGAGRTSTAPTALTWYDATAETIAAAGASAQVTNSRTWAVSWLAAARATRTVPAGVQRGAYQDAALAAAVHRALVKLAPSRTEQLDAKFKETLDAIPDGAAEDRGVAAGERQADLVVASREGDGLDPASVNAPYPVPPAAPGVWQPTPPAHAPATQYGNRLAKPFLLKSQSQFRLGPPPALDSRRYAADLAEVRTYGAADSTARTAHQTETATFWLGSSLTLYTEPLRVALTRTNQGIAGQARLVALFHVALVDTQIATSDSKYAYERWRPVTAIRTGTIDPDQDWTPLHTTPAHPDYPSGHNTYSGAAEAVLSALVGPRTAPFDLTSPTAPGVTRTYTTWKQLSNENVDARVFSGIHTRSADKAGITLGTDVARYVLRNAGPLLAAR
ncbi:phosphatase PAP2 family protein [Streptomyces cyaneochromogenes]|uniref:Phosphatase PAP2 family protein n=1 Tax=Streptomyces cyaneochromogenes TaxID=2496836 RepID=A0A3Q9F0Y3_9ACTN|nr:vanadium-dependent haloperoxidase [Streptomyces cyaneochromogenes]AZQ39895.1 phosphatase PAP2 family protein [Streptomyces cyaneochromogenes]